MNKKTLNDYRDMCYRNAVNKGFHSENPPSHFATDMMLVVTEIAEAVEGDRLGDWGNVKEEIADTYIRLFDICGKYGIDIEYEINKKMLINEKREKMHGKRY